MFTSSLINYAKIAWSCTHFTNLKKLHSNLQHAIRIVHKAKQIRTYKALFQKQKKNKNPEKHHYQQQQLKA